MGEILTNYKQLFQTVLQSCSSRANFGGQEKVVAKAFLFLLLGCKRATNKDVKLTSVSWI